MGIRARTRFIINPSCKNEARALQSPCCLLCDAGRRVPSLTSRIRTRPRSTRIVAQCSGDDGDSDLASNFKFQTSSPRRLSRLSRWETKKMWNLEGSLPRDAATSPATRSGRGPDPGRGRKDSLRTQRPILFRAASLKAHERGLVLTHAWSLLFEAQSSTRSSEDG
ncbi:hypothetical protein D9619_009817 [Psilocybe cf. subviscida]|uniref:Uncharacterized protein n=1 Tax=Psilocybe cf. subviscida TaxID=2480587 RepID=A0A8H5BKL4_9AGAR|nr:hypothetical protein D9619_009817 [Psilocybe cf. subviscida]